MKNILIAEDVKDINNLVADIIKDAGHQVTQANDGEQAIEALDSGVRFDLIILDIIMPHQDGFDVIQYIEKHDINTPVLGMSGGGRTISGEIALKSVEESVAGIIKKPFSKENFLAEVNKILG